MAATAQGRTQGSSRSRFRTGRLESAQMIIPALLHSHLADDTQRDYNSDEEDDDGLTLVERENVRKVLAEMAGTDLGGGASTLSGQRIRSDLVLEDNERRSTSASMGTPITVPSNLPVPLRSISPTPAPLSTVIPVPSAPPVKMSRFKARQLGLQLDD